MAETAALHKAMVVLFEEYVEATGAVRLLLHDAPTMIEQNKRLALDILRMVDRDRPGTASEKLL